MAFQKGQVTNPAGCPKGAHHEGRPADWLKAKCREIVEKRGLVKFLADVAAGESMEQAVGGEGEIISVPAAVRDRIKAAEILLDRGFGRADQHIDLTNNDADRPSTEALVETLRVLRAELDAARAGTGMEAAK